MVAAFATVNVAASGIAFAQGIMPNTPDSPPGWKPSAPKSPGSAKTGEQLVKVRSVADVEQLTPGGTFSLAFVFDIEPGWHIYWKNSGDSGAPTEIKVTGPVGYTFGPVQFPRPTVFEEPEGTVYGYADRTVLFVEVTVPPDVKAGPPAMLRAEIRWLVCKDICLMGRASQMITVPGSAGNAPADQHDSDIAKFKARLPKVIRNGQNGAEISIADSNFIITLPAQGADTAQFFPFDTPGVVYGQAVASAADGRLTVRVPIEVNPNNARGKPIVLGGLIGLGTSPDEPCYEFEHPLSAP